MADNPASVNPLRRAFLYLGALLAGGEGSAAIIHAQAEHLFDTLGILTPAAVKWPDLDHLLRWCRPCWVPGGEAFGFWVGDQMYVAPWEAWDAFFTGWAWL